MANLYKNVGEMEYDGLITDLYPPATVGGGILRKATSAAVTLKRGTVLAKSSGTAGDNKLVALGSTAAENETLTPDCVLCDDVDVGTTEDVNAAVYISGCFDPDKLSFSGEYTLTEADKDALRIRSIILKAAAAAN